jgi:hypothetical protein
LEDRRSTIISYFSRKCMAISPMVVPLTTNYKSEG